jgi:hypothetical protein
MRVDERRISVADLLALQKWVKTGPVASAGAWYKDFGSGPRHIVECACD